MLMVALLRGVNVGGKNKISMQELWESFAEIGFKETETLGNTGIVIFKIKDTKATETRLNEIISEYLRERFDLSILVKVISYSRLAAIVEQLPSWWNTDPDWRHNALFLMKNHHAKEFMDDLPQLEQHIERVYATDDIIFWSTAFTERKLYYRSHYTKLLEHPIYPYLTIRNGNTVVKILKKCEKLM